MNLPPHLTKNFPQQNVNTPNKNSGNSPNNEKLERVVSKNKILPEHKLKNLKRSKQIKQKWKVVRKAGGELWEDPTLEEWPENDFRIFCTDLGNEVSDQLLTDAFRKYPSFQKAKVIRDKRTGKSKGYGFVSIIEADDYIKAMREMNGKYVGNRPVKLRRSNWKDRCLVNTKISEESVKFKKTKKKLNKKILERDGQNNISGNVNLNAFANQSYLNINNINPMNQANQVNNPSYAYNTYSNLNEITPSITKKEQLYPKGV